MRCHNILLADIPFPCACHNIPRSTGMGCYPSPLRPIPVRTRHIHSSSRSFRFRLLTESRLRARFGDNRFNTTSIYIQLIIKNNSLSIFCFKKLLVFVDFSKKRNSLPHGRLFLYGFKKSISSSDQPK